jgi:phosphoglycerate dehydrogenase-like enzyme
MKVAFVGESAQDIERVYGQGRRERVAELAEVVPGALSSADVLERCDELADVQAVFGTWGMPRFTPEQLDCLPSLKAAFFAGSSVKGFAPPMMERGITVVSAASANGVPVAEMTLALILLGLKGYFRNIQDYRTPGATMHECFLGDGGYHATIALLGYGQIARHVRRFLSLHDMHVLAVDPFLSEDDANAEQVESVSMEEAFARSQVVSNHLPALESTRHLIGEKLLRSMPSKACFINTGRGMTVDELALATVLQERPDLMALLDVTDPEPPAADSPLRQLSNVVMSSHLAGGHIGNEVLRLADWMIQDFENWLEDRPLRYAVDPSALHRLA